MYKFIPVTVKELIKIFKSTVRVWADHARRAPNIGPTRLFA